MTIEGQDGIDFKLAKQTTAYAPHTGILSLPFSMVEFSDLLQTPLKTIMEILLLRLPVQCHIEEGD